MDRGTLLLVALALLATASVVLGVSGVRIFRGTRVDETSQAAGPGEADTGAEDPS